MRAGAGHARGGVESLEQLIDGIESIARLAQMARALNAHAVGDDTTDAPHRDHHVAAAAALRHRAGLEIGSDGDRKRHIRGTIVLHMDRAFVDSTCYDLRSRRRSWLFREN